MPVLVNTSFNVKGEPIVETPEDAIHCFLTTGIDYLALHDLLVEKKPGQKVIASLSGMFSEVGALTRAAWTADVRTQR